MAPGKCRLDGLRIGAVDVVDRDAETRQKLFEETIGIAIAMAHRNDALARLDHRQHGCADRRHAAGKSTRRLGTFECGDAALEIMRRRVADTRIDVAAALAGEGSSHALEVLEGEERGLVDRSDHRIVLVGSIVADDERRFGNCRVGR